MKYFIPTNFCNSTFDLALFIQKEVCQQYARDGVAGGIGSRDPTSFEGRSPLYSQQIRREAFLIASLPPTILCYNHKVSKNPLPPPSFNLQKHLVLAIIRKQVIYFYNFVVPFFKEFFFNLGGIIYLDVNYGQIDRRLRLL